MMCDDLNKTKHLPGLSRFFSLFSDFKQKARSEMKLREIIYALYERFNSKFKDQFGFNVKETSFTKVVEYLHAPKDASSLAVTRILFGLAMLFDIPDERGGALLYKRWGNPKMCHFPLFDFIQAVPMPYMTLVYAALWIGALGTMLGYKYHISSPLFTVSYWYLFLIEKSYWNNHSYLFGLLSFLLMFTDANCYWSIDAAFNPEIHSNTVPYWNYFILKFQSFILYFMAGVKKGTAEWLTGYSVPNLSAHWVFTPFTLFLTIEQTDYIIVHWFIFLFDLTVAFWMMWSRTRHVAMVICALFHLMNSRLFSIGMFPWVCLATMPLFYPVNWPNLVVGLIKSQCTKVIERFSKIKQNDKSKPELEQKIADVYADHNDDTIFRTDDILLDENTTLESPENTSEASANAANDISSSETNKVSSLKIQTQDTATKNNVLLQKDVRKSRHDRHEQKEAARNKNITTVLIIIYMTTQGFLPFSHFVTKGYNNWTNGLYGYSWDMMIHTWDVQSVTVKIVDNEKNKHFFIDPYIFSPNDRWYKHGDMVHQYANCISKSLLNVPASQREQEILSKNISIFIDVWCSMNGRFFQRMFDSNVDLLQVSWRAFERNPFLMPLLDEASEWRVSLSKIRNEVHSWDPYSDVVFYADFPDYVLVKYIPLELINVSLTILEGEVAVEAEEKQSENKQSIHLITGHQKKLGTGIFHRISNIGKKTAYYMFTFQNKSETHAKSTCRPIFKLPILTELQIRFTNMLVYSDVLFKGLYQSILQLPALLL